jgi:hypothetical protein
MKVGELRFTLTAPLEPNTVDWESLLLQYGIPSALIALEVLEEDGFYEVCGDILKAVEETSIADNEPYPSRINDDFLLEICSDLNKSAKVPMELERAREIYTNHAQLILAYLGYKLEP